MYGSGTLTQHKLNPTDAMATVDYNSPTFAWALQYYATVQSQNINV